MEGEVHLTVDFDRMCKTYEDSLFFASNE